MLDPSAIRRRFGTYLPLFVVKMIATVLFVLCLGFLGHLQESHEGGITYSIHFSGMGELIVFAAGIGVLAGLYLRVSRWLARRDPAEVDREERFFARIKNYNETRNSMPHRGS